MEMFCNRSLISWDVVLFAIGFFAGWLGTRMYYRGISK